MRTMVFSNYLKLAYVHGDEPRSVSGFDPPPDPSYLGPVSRV